MKFNWKFKGVFSAERPEVKGSSNDKRRYKRREKLRCKFSDDCVRSWDDIIPNDSFFQHLSSEAKLLWTMYGGDRGNARSLWIDRTATPKCALELFAQKIASFHCSRLGGDGMYIGAEYWVQQRVASCPRENIDQVTNETQGLEFHFDKDELAAEEEFWVHPLFSTATYLDARIEGFPSGGAPLVVFETLSEEEGDEEEEGEEEEDAAADDDDDEDDDEAPQLVELEHENEHDDESDEDEEEQDPQTPLSAWVVFPTQNRHVCFPGGYLHGVAGELMIPSLLLTLSQSSQNTSDTIADNSVEKVTAENKKSKKSSNVKPINKIKDEINEPLTTSGGKTDYKYSRLSLLVNVWTSCHPKAVKRMDIKSFKLEFQEKIKEEEKNSGIKHQKNQVEKLDFNFDSFLSKIESDENNSCMSFAPRNGSGKRSNPESINLRSIGSRRRKIYGESSFVPVCVDEVMDDGVIRAVGTGVDEGAVCDCYVEVPAEKVTDEIQMKNNENQNNTPTPQSDPNPDLYYLEEHRPCDTAPLPLGILRREFQKFSARNNGNNCDKLKDKVVHILYSYEDRQDHEM